MHAITRQEIWVGRPTGLAPFQVEVEGYDEPTPRDPGLQDIRGGSPANEGDPAYGCVEWYAYPQWPGSKSQRHN
jgi:hypothetical protein